MWFESQPADGTLVAQVLEGQRDQFGLIVARHLPAAHATAYAYTRNQHDAEDVVQEAFLKAYRALPELRDPERLGAWIARIVRNLALNSVSKRKREAEVHEAVRFEPTVESRPDFEEREHRALLVKHIEAMEPAAAEVLLLHYYAGKSTAEIAAIAGISRHAAKKRLERARGDLSEAMLASLAPRETAESDRRVRAIMGMVAAAPAVWTPQAQAAGIGAVWGSSLKGASLLYCAGAVLVAVASVVIVRVYDRGQEIALPVVIASPASQRELAPLETEEALRTTGAITEDDAVTTKTSRIAGKLVDAKTGNAIADTFLLLDFDEVLPGYPEPTVRTTLTSVTGADGSFEFANLSPGVYGMRTQEMMTYPSHQEVARGLELGAGETLEHRVELSQDVAIRGKVVDPSGQALAEVTLEGITNQENAVRRGISLEDGSFVISGFLSGGVGFEVSATKSYYAMPPLFGLTVPPEGLDGLELVMYPESTISGVVLDETGATVAFADVWARAVQPADIRLFKGIAGEKGEFTLGGLYPGSFALGVKDPGKPTWSTQDEQSRVEIGAGEARKDLRLSVIRAAGLSIEGFVRNASATVHVSAGDQETSVDEDGAFKITGLQPGRYQVSAIDFGPAPFRGEKVENVAAGTTGLEITFKALASIEGKVVDAASGLPVKRFELSTSPGIHAEMNGHHMWQLQAREDAEGKFRVSKIEPGNATLFVRAPDYAPATMPLTEIAPGAALSDVTISLERGIVLSGTVVDSVASPVAGAAVFLGSIPEQQMLTHAAYATTDPQGRFFFHTGATQDATLSAYHPDHAPAAVTAKVGGVSRRDITIRLSNGGDIQGTATLAGEPLWGKTALLLQDGVDRARVKLDERGAFVFQHVLPGLATVLVNVDWLGNSKDYFLCVRRDVTVEEGGDAIVNIETALGTAAVQGVVQLPATPDGEWRMIRLVAGPPTAGAIEVMLHNSNQSEFFVENLPEGPLRAEVEYQDEVGPTARVIIPLPDLVADEVLAVTLEME